MRAIACGLLFASSTAFADVRLPAIFSDRMVLQQGKKINVWGWADPGEEVQITVAGSTAKTQAGDDGRWTAQLSELKAGGPHTFTVQGKNSIELKDVLVGEVWLCSGQSNMAMTVSGCLDAEKEIAESSNSQLRMFTVGRNPQETPQPDVKGQWAVSGPETTGGFSATAYFFGRRLQKELGVPIGLINSSYGGTNIVAWTSTEVQERNEKFRPILAAWQQRIDSWDPKAAQANYEAQLKRWEEQVKVAKAEGKQAPARPRAPINPKFDPNRPGNLFNGMIAPLIPYSIRGALWYQGEANASPAAAPLYGLQLETMIEEWRTRMGQGDFPFLWVQLPNFMAAQKQPSEDSGWVIVREEMLKTLRVPNTGMAITVDVGEADDIHPRNKQAVGFRLAQWALATEYGKDIVRGGPLFTSMEKQGSKIVLGFADTADELKTSDGKPLRGFAIAGADRKFVWANAKIEGSTVVVWSDEISEPQSVRYNWANNPDGNLVNAAGLPASPFRTDDWEVAAARR